VVTLEEIEERLPKDKVLAQKNQEYKAHFRK
jgi:hypothetical protein